MSTKIEWCEETCNPFAGCTKISPGCDHCYAERMANRLASIAIKNDNSEFFKVDGMGKYALVIRPEGKWNGKTVFDKSALDNIFHWKKPRMIFMVSMSDLFHENNALNDIAMVFAAMYLNQRHTFQILTKRPERAEYVLRNDEFWFSYHKYCNQLHDEYINPLEQELYFYDEVKQEWPLRNVWFGVTAENQMRANERIPLLLQIPAAKRFISVEPMLTAINLDGYLPDPEWRYLCSEVNVKTHPMIEWVICGGESGPGSRPLHPDWVRSLRDQCQTAGTPFFFKQWGGVNKKLHGSLLDGKEYKKYPESTSP